MASKFVCFSLFNFSRNFKKIPKIIQNAVRDTFLYFFLSGTGVGTSLMCDPSLFF